MIPRIAIISASSQVGASTALYLRVFKKANLIAYSRTAYPAPFFDAMGIPHRILPIDRDAQREELAQFDLVVDFSVPHAEFWENKAILRAHLTGLFESLRPGTLFISMSTQNAFGFRDNDVFIRKRLTDWASPYCSLKRHGERLARRLGRKRRVQVFNFRLSQVHGFLQSVSHRFCEEISGSKSLMVAGLATDRVNTMFISDLGEAILQIASGQLRPGNYSVLSVPQWTQEQLYRYYQDWCRSDCDVVFIGHKSRSTLAARGISHLARAVEKHRGFIDVAILQRLPRIAARAKGIHRIRSFTRQPATQGPVVHRNLLGKPPLPILGDPRGSPTSVLVRERRMEETWLSALGSAVHYSPPLTSEA